MSLAESKTITPKLPRDLPKAAKVKVSKAIEAHLAAVHALVEWMDAAEGESDADDEDDGTLEDEPDREEGGDDEPSLGAPEGKQWMHCENDDDREGDPADEGEPSEDPEPSLAHTNDMDQTRAARHLVAVNGRHGTPWHRMDADLEADHDGWEPSLGSVAATGNQTGWARGAGGDLEDEHDGTEPDMEGE